MKMHRYGQHFMKSEHIFCIFLILRTYVHYLQRIPLPYVKGQLGLETSAPGAKWKSQLYPFPPTTLGHSLESSVLGVRVKESSSSGGRDKFHLDSLPPVK